MKMTRIAVAVAVTGALTVLGAASATGAEPTRARGAGQLRDLQAGTEQPTDHATAQVVAVESDGSTTIKFKVQGIDHRAAGMELGAHIHVGPCLGGDGAAAGPHYNSTGNPPLVINDQTEVWLDVTVGANGTARAETTVPFVIPTGGAASLVIHADETSTGPAPPAGSAGPRWACLPVQF